VQRIAFGFLRLLRRSTEDETTYKLNRDFKKCMQEVFRCLAVNLRRKPRQRRRRNKRTAAPDLKRPSLFFLILKKF